MKKLILITNAFPWGKIEKSFIMPELPYLQKKFKVTILSRAPMQLLEQKEDETPLADDIELMHYQEEVPGKFEKFCLICKAVKKKEFRGEIKEVIKKKRGIYSIKETVFFWIRAVKFREWMRDHNLFDDPENTIFYSYWANYSVCSLAMEKKENSQIKFMTRTHGYDLYHERFPGGWQPFKRFVDQWIDKIVFIAKVGYEYYLSHYADTIDDKRYVICKMGVNKPLELPQKKEDIFRIVSCSAVSELKRVHMIVDALAKINFQIEWHHFGNGPEFENIKELSSSLLDKKENVTYILHGFVQNEDVMNYYRDNWVDCFITTSSSEGCPVSIQEALAYGISIIGTDVGEIKYMIEKNGILLRQTPTTDEIADAIVKIYECYNNNETRAMMRENSLAIWERDYQLEKNINDFVAVLEKI